MQNAEIDAWHMRRALDLALFGRGAVEPNPLVGCVIAQGAEIIGEGWHRRFGGPHAEIEALAVAGSRASGATLYVTLEPCCHYGKTPPCTKAIIAAGIRRVVLAQVDPFPAVQGGGVAELRSSGIEVETGLLEADARRMNAPYLKLLAIGRPWVIGKWAMTLDGKIATRTGSSRWISGEASRRVAHELRGRVDAIVVGRRTVEVDDPLLTARPRGPRVAMRIVVDRMASLSSTSRLVSTCREAPVLIAVGPESPEAERQRLIDAGCEVFVGSEAGEKCELIPLLDELGRRRMTNVLVEGGGTLLGALFDAGEMDEVHVFIATKLVGGDQAVGPVGGMGLSDIAEALHLEQPEFAALDRDMYVHGYVGRSGRAPSD